MNISRLDVTTIPEWEAIVREMTDTGYSRERAEAIATAQLKAALA